MSESFDMLTRRRLKDLLTYCLIYPEVHGLILAISEKDIDFEKGLVKGYYYSPNLKEAALPWKEGIFPLPDSIFTRIYISDDTRLNLQKVSDNGLFNSKYFNKWEFWRMMTKFKAYCGFIPETKRLYSIDDIDHMLSSFSSVYIKPTNGTLSRGLYMIKKDNENYHVEDKHGDKIEHTDSREEVQKFIDDILSGRGYLVQQALEPIGFEGRHVDFRVIMQKNHSRMWNCTTIIAFAGRPGEICSNWGYTLKFEDILEKYFHFSQQEIYLKKQEIISACRTVCGILEMTGENYGDFGFDVVLDKDFKVWILEANKRHFHTVPLWNNDEETYYEVKANTLRYATALDGFKVY
jgi:hypothetical protein